MVSSKLQEQIESDLKQAMRNKETEKVSTLRMVISAIRNKEIMLRKGEEVEFTDEHVTEVLTSEIKKRKDAIEAYEQGERQDLAEKEKTEITIIEKYLPEQMNDEEIEKIVREIIETYDDVSQKDFGKIMGQVMVQVKGRADGSKVSEIVKNILSR